MAETQADTVGRFTGDGALKAERQHLHGGDAPADLAALCLSGGGIRSAAFALGVLQGLARRGLLTRFHYLSTVSGGGYTGAWLTTLLQHRGAAEVQRMLKNAAEGQEPVELRQLRASSNFLTPQPGLFSADTWSAVMLYIRNLLLTWLGLLPVMLLGVLVLVMTRTLVANAWGSDEALLALVLCGLVLAWSAWRLWPVAGQSGGR